MFVLVRKPCTKCGEMKPLDEFCLQVGGRYGRHPRCRACRSEREKLRYLANREAILERQRTSEAKRRYREEHDRLRRYGVSSAEFRRMAILQQHRCAICGEQANPLCLDHDHETGEVRGLLCRGCNIGIGRLRDDPDRCRAAADYLERYSRPSPGEVPESG